MYIDKDELLKAIKERYGEHSLNDDSGCSCYNEDKDDYIWISIKAIVDLIEDCQEYDD